MKLLPRHRLHGNKLLILSTAVQANQAAGTRNALEQEKAVGRWGKQLAKASE